MANLAIANEILNQLGGKHFIALTGAQNLAGGENSLQFKIGSGAKNQIKWVRIELTDGDDYMMKFYKSVKSMPVLVSEIDGVYCDQLQEIFTEQTGFYTKF